MCVCNHGAYTRGHCFPYVHVFHGFFVLVYVIFFLGWHFQPWHAHKGISYLSDAPLAYADNIMDTVNQLFIRNIFIAFGIFHCQAVLSCSHRRCAISGNTLE